MDCRLPIGGQEGAQEAILESVSFGFTELIKTDQNWSLLRNIIVSTD